MKITTLLAATLGAAVLAGASSASASAAPARHGDGYVNRAVRSPNGKDVFVRVVKVPRMQAAAMCACPMTDSAQPEAVKPPAQG